MTLKLNLNKIEAAKAQALVETALLLGREFTRVISTPGLFDGFDGDIVDTGELRRSQQPPEKVGRKKFRFRWSVNYATPVHEGAAFSNGRILRGRPWTSKALEQFDLKKTFGVLMAAYMRRS